MAEKALTWKSEDLSLDSWLCYLQFEGPGANHLAYLKLGFLACKTGVILSSHQVIMMVK